jgi:hypothetical protein
VSQQARIGNDLSIYQSSPTAAPAAAPGQPAPTSGSTALDRRDSMAVTIILLAVLMICSLVLLVGGLALAFERDAAQVVNIVLIALGGSLVFWHLRALLFGSGRRTAQISPWPWVGLVVIAAFGVTLGFSLFDLLTNVRSAARIALFSTGVVGMAAAMIAFVRDADMHERRLNAPLPQTPAVPDPEPEPVLFDPTRADDELRPRGVWPQPKRGSAADASLWSAPDFEEDPAPRRARRAAD